METSDLNQIFTAQLNEDEEDFYEALISSKGNFISFPSPIKEDWQNAVSSPFGYRLDLISKEVTFHAGIDIAKPTGTELVSIIDGKVIQTGYDANGYGHYIVVGVYKPTKWMNTTIENFPDLLEDCTDRYGFVGEEASEEVTRIYMRRRVPSSYRKKGASNPIRYNY
ncbi:peptidoglycan DD-metalloendopeptidase family protein [Fusibacter sp. 3D3]|uniref:peptidoglycan DD-metalloendopeptidase family protein n=1 Tax=Fusibacter sp. 3D3 TaxID=1048380 RepID=UPI0008530B3B|nr:peptidoglycan DD-metalloendopeptidase family protein [Fusibacter sp. 3D3]GAU79887.1 membrane proteins related to metalloendopeptidases [Fusibacter sp. 3D3]